MRGLIKGDSTTGIPPVFRRLLPLTARSSRALDEAFARGRPGVIPDNVTTGIGLAWTGTWISSPLAWFFWLFWKGKTFDRQRGQLVNRILPLDIPAIRAAVRAGDSIWDGRPCVVIDYSQHGLIGRIVRDEIREIEPGMYLGLTFLFGRRLMRFALVERRHERPT